MTLAIALIVIGLLLIAAELCFPTVGLLGALAFVCILAGVYAGFAESTSAGMILLAVSVVLVPAMILIGFKLFPKSPVGKHMVAHGFTFDDGAAIDRRDVALVGREGVVEALLRPSGVARFEGRRVDVMSRGEPIESGARVRVIEVEGNRVVVARAGDPVRDRGGDSVRDSAGDPMGDSGGNPIGDTAGSQ